MFGVTKDKEGTPVMLSITDDELRRAPRMSEMRSESSSFSRDAGEEDVEDTNVLRVRDKVVPKGVSIEWRAAFLGSANISQPGTFLKKGCMKEFECITNVLIV